MLSCSGSAPQALSQKTKHTQTPNNARYILKPRNLYLHVVEMIATPLKMMLGMVRKVLGCLGRLWLCVIGIVCRGKRRHGGEGEQSQRAKETHDMNWDAEGWDEFSVTVVPNEATAADQPQLGVSQDQAPNENNDEQDLFQDMRPVFRKPQKVWISKGQH